MTTRTFPSIRVRESAWEFVSNARSFISPLTGYIQVAQRGGNRWRVTLNMSALNLAERAEMQAFVVRVLAEADNFTLPPSAYTQRGVGVGNFLRNDAAAVASSTAVVIKNYYSSVFTNAALISELGLRPGDIISFSGEKQRAASAGQVGFLLSVLNSAGTQISQFGPNYTSTPDDGTWFRDVYQNFTLPEAAHAIRFQGVSQSSGTVGSVRNAMLNLGPTAADFEKALVAGAGQTGYALNIDGVIASTTNWRRAGDMIQVGNEMKMVTGDVNTNASGEATIPIAPELRASPADNAEVKIARPRGIFRFETNASGWNNYSPALSDFVISCIEDVAA